MVPKVIKAHVADIPKLNEISIAAKMHWDYPQEWLKLWEEDLKLSSQEFADQCVFKLELTNEMIGFCTLQEEQEFYEVNHLWVLPNYLGKGYGKLLLMETLAKGVLKKKEIRVVADPNAEGFYASQGFVTFDSIESLPKGRFLPLMRKEVRAD